MRRKVIEIVRTISMTALLTVAIMSVLLYAPSPFVVTKPGIAVPTDRYIKLINDNDTEMNGKSNAFEAEVEMNGSGNGQFLLTAILLETPNIWNSLGSLFVPGHDVKLKHDVLGGATIQEYVEIVSTMMQGSHYNAIEAAYRFLGIKYSIKPQQIVVQQVKPQVRTSAALEAGDKLVALKMANGLVKELTSMEQLATLVKEQAVQPQTDHTAKQVVLIAERNSNQFELSIELSGLKLNQSNELFIADALDVISFVEIRSIEPEDEKYKVEIVIDNIGGPSAGLAFTLTIINLLTEGDLADGKKIAVTGTIEPTGNVGVIGGVKQKVYATSKQGADLFIIPKGNEKEAIRALKSMNSDMEVVGVSKLEEAIEVIASVR